MSDLSSRLLPCWTAIAERPRQSATTLEWHMLAGAPLHFKEARALAAKGAIIMAQRHFPDRVELLVRPAMDRIIVPAMPREASRN
jgi:hypothetical protein